MDRMLKAELQLQLEKFIFWTDSTSTLKYIQNENKRFKTFIANRVNTIREMTSIKQWRYVNTKQDPADCASRGLKASTLLNSSTWLSGPEFLKGQRSEWPKSELVLQEDERWWCGSEKGSPCHERTGEGTSKSYTCIHSLSLKLEQNHQSSCMAT